MSRIVTKRSGVNGLWIAKATFDAATCAQDAMLLSSDMSIAQPIASGYGQMTVSGSFMAFTVALPASVAGNTRFLVTHQIYQSIGGSVVPVSPGYNADGLLIGSTNIYSDGTTLHVEANGINTSNLTYINYVIYRAKY